MSLGLNLAEFFNEQLGEIGIDTSPLIGEILVSILIFAIFIILGWIVYRIFERYFYKVGKKNKDKFG
jgi:peptidoglycan/LPS O-acetylase OafA/YrhL